MVFRQRQCILFWRDSQSDREIQPFSNNLRLSKLDLFRQRDAVIKKQKSKAPFVT